MTDNIENKESLNPVADRVEKRTKEISMKSEKISRKIFFWSPN